MNTLCARHFPPACHLLTHLFQTPTTTLRDSFRTRLNLPDGKLAAIAGVHTFGDYLIFHHRFLHALRDAKLISPNIAGTINPIERRSHPDSRIHLTPSIVQKKIAAAIILAKAERKAMFVRNEFCRATSSFRQIPAWTGNFSYQNTTPAKRFVLVKVTAN